MKAICILFVSPQIKNKIFTNDDRQKSKHLMAIRKEKGLNPREAIPAEFVVVSTDKRRVNDLMALKNTFDKLMLKEERVVSIELTFWLQQRQRDSAMDIVNFLFGDRSIIWVK